MTTNMQTYVTCVARPVLERRVCPANYHVVCCVDTAEPRINKRLTPRTLWLDRFF